MELTIFSFISIFILLGVYFFLITEKLNKVMVVGIGACVLIILQIFKTNEATSQATAIEFVARNLDVLGFVVGMMLLIGIIRQCGLFEAIAIWIVKLVKGKPFLLLIALGYLSLVMTIFLSNIPTILILTPIILVLIRELKLPHIPFLLVIVTMANIGGATTPFSDPTTYYQAKTVGLSFLEVVGNSGFIVLILSPIVVAYTALLFRNDLKKVKVSVEDLKLFNPKAAIKDKKLLKIGTPILVISILFMILKEYINSILGISLDNATIVIFASFIIMLIFNINPIKAIETYIDWEIIFFFMGLFIVVGSLEHTGVIASLGKGIVAITHGNIILLLFIITLGSCILSMFIDNVPYNITMVGAIQAMANDGIKIYPLWWALNLGTSIGGAGSMIGAACNVVAFGQAEKDGYHTNFLQYLMYGTPLVIINGLVTFGILYLRYKA